jgi:periplasmic copper chaperone A
MTSPLRRSTMRTAVVAGVGAVVTLVGAAPALAHVTAQPGQAAQGGYTVISFRVPDESDTAGTVKLQVTLPTDHPITSVRTTPIAGWTATVARTTLNPPVQVNGNAVTEAVGSVTWTANPGIRINPGEYLDFPLSLGPLPTGVDQIALPAVQTYDNGEVVSWDQPSTGGAEPERPAPVVTLTAAPAGDGMADHGGDSTPAAAPADTAAPSASDTTARWLAGAGLLVGALGLGVGAGAVLRTRRTGTR